MTMRCSRLRATRRLAVPLAVALLFAATSCRGGSDPQSEANGALIELDQQNVSFSLLRPFELGKGNSRTALNGSKVTNFRIFDPARAGPQGSSAILSIYEVGYPPAFQLLPDTIDSDLAEIRDLFIGLGYDIDVAETRVQPTGPSFVVRGRKPVSWRRQEAFIRLSTGVIAYLGLEYPTDLIPDAEQDDLFDTIISTIEPLQ